MHDIGLIVTLAAGLAAALAFGFLTEKLRLSPILGYLLAGIAVGPHTPGFIADAAITAQLAEVGVVLLMFGVGLHFRLADLFAVRRIAIPGAVGQSVVATLLAAGVAHWLGWGFGAGLALGVGLSVASTVVLMRVLADSRLLDTPHGHIAVGWLVVEDIFTVLVLVLLPVTATAFVGGGGGLPDLARALGLAVLKVGIFAAAMLVVGARVIPWMLTQVARTRSRELISIAANPALFRTIGPIEAWLQRQPRLWAFLNRRSGALAGSVNADTEARLRAEAEAVRAVVVGYGPAGRTVCRILEDFGVRTVVVDLNVETVARLSAEGRLAIYGDASRSEILRAAGIEQASYLLLTMPDPDARIPVILAAREMNPKARILARAHYIAERAMLEEVGATAVYEEAEAAVALAGFLLREIGADEARIDAEARRIRAELAGGGEPPA